LIGETFSHYKILEKIGQGGMGEVYRARDSKLGRDVALKLLPVEFADDAERVARFEREARTLASVNHSHIASIFEVGESNGRRYLSMENVEGEDLSVRLKRGPIPLDETLDLARQIAEGLEAAHDSGIVHRDLKPANIMVTSAGDVKILDFGLALAVQSEAESSQNLSLSPTISVGMTRAGVILGTAAYMSPEQARGKPVDRRADLWAFGAILWEMLTGKSLFEGETISDTLANILRKDPDWDDLPTGIPSGLRRLMRRCLERDPRVRQRSAGDAVLDLAETDSENISLTGAPGLTERTRTRSLVIIPWAVAAVLLALLLTQMLRGQTRHSEHSVVPHFEIIVPEGHGLSEGAISPDGTTIALATTDPIGNGGLFLRDIDDIRLRPVEETEEVMNLFWSPDSRHIGYMTRSTLKTFSPDTETFQTLWKGVTGARGGSWGSDGTILFAPEWNAEIYRIDADGGEAVAVTRLDTSVADASHRWPSWMADGEHFLYTLWSNSVEVQENEGGIYVGSVEDHESYKILEDDGASVFMEPDLILFHRAGRLMVTRFDPEQQAVVGDPWIAVEAIDIEAASGKLLSSISSRGDLCFMNDTGTDILDHLVWIDRSGERSALLPFEMVVRKLTLAADGSRFAAEVFTLGSGIHVWVGEFERGTMTRLTRGALDYETPVISPDGSLVAFTDEGGGNLIVSVKEVIGTAPASQIFGAGKYGGVPTDWSRDGRYLLLTAWPNRGGKEEVWVHDFETGETRPLLADNYQQGGATLSPDGQWLAYVSEESGRKEVYVRPFPSLDRQWQVSTTGCLGQPYWKSDGSELAFVAAFEGTRTLLSVDFDGAGADPVISSPRRLLTFEPDMYLLVPQANFQRYLGVIRETGGASGRLRVILGWRDTWEVPN